VEHCVVADAVLAGASLYLQHCKRYLYNVIV